jgi:hypothetical protein
MTEFPADSKVTGNCDNGTLREDAGDRDKVRVYHISQSPNCCLSQLDPQECRPNPTNPLHSAMTKWSTLYSAAFKKEVPLWYSDEIILKRERSRGKSTETEQSARDRSRPRSCRQRFHQTNAERERKRGKRSRLRKEYTREIGRDCADSCSADGRRERRRGTLVSNRKGRD